MYASSVLARGKAAMVGSETEQRIAVLLYDDNVVMISSLELNQLASLTYHEAQVFTSDKQDMVEILVTKHLEQIVSKPVNYSTITVLKCVTVIKHLLLYGSEKIIPILQQQIGRYVAILATEYNTVLLAQQTPSSWLMKIKGGGVDKGGPVRDVAIYITKALQCAPEILRSERTRRADPHSLVPVGSSKKIAFATDEVKWKFLQQQMEEQNNATRIKSNLQKAQDGFGSGYASKDGKMVVGAAHGIEEMIRMQQREESKFKDEQQKVKHQQQQAFNEYQAPKLLLGVDDGDGSTTANNTNNERGVSGVSGGNNSINKDTGDLISQQPENDLLMGSAAATGLPVPVPTLPQQQQQQQQQQSAEIDLLDLGGGGGSSSQPPPAVVTTTASSNSQQHHHQNEADLLFGGTTATSAGGSYTTTHQQQQSAEVYTATTAAASQDPFQLVTAPVSPPSATNNLMMQNLSLNSSNTTMPLITTMQQQQQQQQPMHLSQSAAATKEDPFAALDALAEGSGGVGPANTAQASVPGMMLGSHLGGAASTAANTASIATATHPSLSLADSFGAAANDTDLAFAMPHSAMTAGAPMPTPNLSSIRVSGFASGGLPDYSNNSEEGDGFVMGGTTGSGLEPQGTAPAAAPPPPPPPPPPAFGLG